MRLAKPSHLKLEDTNPLAWNRFEFGQTPGLTGSTAPEAVGQQEEGPASESDAVARDWMLLRQG
jgi:hypothetical protein